MKTISRLSPKKSKDERYWQFCAQRDFPISDRHAAEQFIEMILECLKRTKAEVKKTTAKPGEHGKMFAENLSAPLLALRSIQLWLIGGGLSAIPKKDGINVKK